MPEPLLNGRWYENLAAVVMVLVIFGASVAGWVLIFELAAWMFG